MSEIKITIPKNAMNYGAITGIVLFLVFVLNGVLGISASSILSIVSFLVLIAGIFIGTKNYRDNNLEGNISYGNAFYSGFLISFFASVIIAFAAFLYFKFVDTDIIDKALENAESDLLAKYQNDDEKAEQGMVALRWLHNPSVFSIILVISLLSLFLLLSLFSPASFLIIFLFAFSFTVLISSPSAFYSS